MRGEGWHQTEAVVGGKYSSSPCPPLINSHLSHSAKNSSLWIISGYLHPFYTSDLLHRRLFMDFLIVLRSIQRMKNSPWPIPTSISGILAFTSKAPFLYLCDFHLNYDLSWLEGLPLIKGFSLLHLVYFSLQAVFVQAFTVIYILISRMRLSQHQQHKPINLSNVLPHIVSFVAYFFRPPLDRSFSGYLGFWHQVRVISGHFDTRQCKEASVITKIIASLTMILSQMPKPLHHCSSVIAQFYSCESKTVDEE